MPDKVRVENLVKIFGDNPQEGLNRFRSGVTREQMLQEGGQVLALSDVSFSVGTGEVFVVMGLSGSGKSTLIRCINRLINPTSGNIYIDDEDIVTASDERLRELRRTRLSMVFQHFALFPHRTVVENVEYGLKVRKVPRQERREKALETLDIVGLRDWADRSPANLSGGMQQRVGLARALATDPDILLMDEAFSALDPLIRREMQDDLIELQRTVQKTILFITHDLSEALKIGDHIAVMKDGAIVQIGAPEEIVANPSDDYVAAFTQDVDRGRVFSVASIMKADEYLTRGRDTVRTAVPRMRESGRNALYVVTPHPQHRRCLGGPVGIVTEQAIAGAVRQGVTDLDQVLTTDFPTTNPTSSLADIYGLSATGLPIAVVDEQGCLMGVVDQLDLLGHLAIDNSSPNGNGASPSENSELEITGSRA